MGLILKILGILFLVGIALVVFVVWFIKRKLRQLGNAFAEFASGMVQPDTISLRLGTDEPLRDPEVGKAVAAFQELGYQRGPAYVVAEVPSLEVVPFVSPAAGTYGVVYRHQGGNGVWSDVVARYADGGSLTVSNSGHSQGLKPMPGHDKVYLPHESVEALHRRYLETRPGKELKPVDLTLFPQEFERAYAEEIAWRNQEGVSVDEIRAISSNSGIDASEEVIGMTATTVRRRGQAQLHETLRIEFLRSGQISASEWDEVADRVVFVHDGLSTDDLIDLLEEGTDEDLDELEIADGLTAREAFVKANASLRPEVRFKPLGMVVAPVEADVYAAPEV